MEALLTNLREQIQSEFAGSPQTLDVFERIASSVLACSAATHSSLQTLRSERNSFESQCVALRAQVAGLRSLVSISGTSPLAAVKQNDTSVSPPESEPAIQSSDTLSTTTAEEGGRSGPTLELGDMMSMLRLEMEGHRFCSECSAENTNDADLCVCCEAPLLQGELEPIRLDEYDKTTGEDQKMSKLRASVEEEASNQLSNDDDAATQSHQSLHVTAATRGIMPVSTASTTASSSSDGVRNGMELMGNFFSQLPSGGSGGGGGGSGGGGEQGAIRRATIAVKSSSSSTHTSAAPLTSSPPVSLLGNFMQPAVAEDNKLKNEDDYDNISDLLGKTASGGAIAVRTPTKSQLPSMESVVTEQQQEVEVGVEVEGGRLHKEQQSTSVEPAPMAMNFQGLMKDFSAHGIKAEKEDDDDDEPMEIEIDLAARFQQMAGIYDSKPKDFARDMRDKGSESSTGSIMSSSGLSRMSGSRGETNQKISVSFAEDSKDGASLEGQVSCSSSSSNEQAMHANSRAVGGDECGGNGNGEGGEDLYVTRAPKHPTSAQKHRFVGGRSKEPQERTLKEVGDEYIWKKFMNREEEEDTDSDEDEEKVRGLDYKLKVVCQEMRTFMPREDMKLTVFVANAKYKKRYLLGRRKWRYFVSTKVEKKRKKKTKIKSIKSTKSTTGEKKEGKEREVVGGGERRREEEREEEREEWENGTRQVVVRRRYDQFVWIRNVIDKLYNGTGTTTKKSKKERLPIVPQPKSSDRVRATKLMSEWVQNMHTLEVRGLHLQCMEWTMFLSSSDYEFETYCKQHSIPNEVEQQRNIKELSEHLLAQQKEHVAFEQTVFGAMMGALDGEYDHSSVGTALTSSLFKRDQIGSLESTMAKLHSSDGTDPAPLLHAVKEEMARYRRNQSHWMTVRHALLASKLLNISPGTADNNGKTMGERQTAHSKNHSRNHSEIMLMGLERRNDWTMVTAAVAVDSIEEEALKRDVDIVELFGGQPTSRGENRTGTTSEHQRTASRPRTDATSGSRMVARLVPPHMISGHRVPLSSSNKKSSNYNTPEVHLFAGQIVTFGRDVANDIQVRDAAASRKHGLIEVSQDGRVYFVDVGSSNGTEVDGLHISNRGRVQLNSGSRIRIGDTYYFCLLEKEEKKEKKEKKMIESQNVIENEQTNLVEQISSYIEGSTNAAAATTTTTPVQKIMDTKASTNEQKFQENISSSTPTTSTSTTIATTTTTPLSAIVVSVDKTDMEQLQEVLEQLVASGHGHYTDARNVVSKRWGPSFFKKNRDNIRQMLEKIINKPLKTTRVRTGSFSQNSAKKKSLNQGNVAQRILKQQMQAKRTLKLPSQGTANNVSALGADAVLADLIGAPARRPSSLRSSLSQISNEPEATIEF